MKPVPLAELRYATFVSLLHSRFRVHGGPSGMAEIELVEATAHSSGPETAPTQAGTFSLVFAGPRHPFLPQRTYRFEHEKIGAFDLFIVPIGEDQNGFRYEAVFNRPVQPGTLKTPV